MTNKEIKLKIYGKVMNAGAKHATLDGICFGLSLMNEMVDESIEMFVEDFNEVICMSDGKVLLIREWAEKYKGWNE